MGRIHLFPHSQRSSLKQKMLRNQRSRIRNLNSSKKSLALATQRVDPVINLSMVNFEPQKQLQLNDSKEIIFTSNNSQVNLSEFNNTRNNTQVIEGSQAIAKLTRKKK